MKTRTWSGNITVSRTDNAGGGEESAEMMTSIAVVFNEDSSFGRNPSEIGD